MEKVIMLEIRTQILPSRLLCAKACKIKKKKKDKSLRVTDKTGQYATFLPMRNSSVVILRPVLVRFYRTGEETVFERHRSRVLINKEPNNYFLTEKQLTLRRTSQLIPTVVQKGKEGLRTIPRQGFRSIKVHMK